MSARSQSTEVHQLVDHLFRHKSAEMLAVLVRIFGVENLELAEDVVQETLMKALQRWPYTGIPENPGAWLYATAKNHTLDVLRRNTLFRSKSSEIIKHLHQFEQYSTPLAPQFEDDQLTMMLLCCHPVLSRESQIALILKTLCGFNVSEIARAFFSNEEAIAQRLVRARRKLKEERARFEMPDSTNMPLRLTVLLDVLYLLFNEGYAATEGDHLVRYDLCEEAIRLTNILVDHPQGSGPETHALLALMLFQASRLNTRVDPEGKLLLLCDQDRTKWDDKLIQAAFRCMDSAAAGDSLSRYHLEAGIAACHALAPDCKQTNWPRILDFYDALIELDDSPVLRLNRAVAISMIEGPKRGLAELEKLESNPILNSYYLLPATFADFYAKLGKNQEAIAYYTRTLSLTRTDPERRFVLSKLFELQGKPLSGSSP